MGDALKVINPDPVISFTDMRGGQHVIERWDLIIAHPPCTSLSVAGARWFTEGRKPWSLQDEAADFFMKFVNADCDHIAVENPISVMSTRYRKPDQIIQPYWFGHAYSKKTCLWLKNLPKLEPTNIVEPVIIKDKNGVNYSGAAYYAVKDGKILSWNDPETAKIRSKTPEGLAKAIAEQWSEYLMNEGIE